MVRINLLPVKVSRKKEAGKQQLLLFAVVLVAGLIVNYVWIAQRTSALDALKADVARKKAEIAQLEKIIGEVKNIRTEQDQLKQKLEVLDKLKAGRSGPVKMLDELATVTPKRLWLTKMEEKSGTVTFQGTASTIDDVSSFMAALKSSKHFGKVELKKTAAATKSSGKGASFRLVDFTVTASASYGGIAAATAEEQGKQGAQAAPAKR